MSTRRDILKGLAAAPFILSGRSNAQRARDVSTAEPGDIEYNTPYGVVGTLGCEHPFPVNGRVYFALTDRDSKSFVFRMERDGSGIGPVHNVYASYQIRDGMRGLVISPDESLAAWEGMTDMKLLGKRSVGVTRRTRTIVLGDLGESRLEPVSILPEAGWEYTCPAFIDGKTMLFSGFMYEKQTRENDPRRESNMLLRADIGSKRDPHKTVLDETTRTLNYDGENFGQTGISHISMKEGKTSQLIAMEKAKPSFRNNMNSNAVGIDYGHFIELGEITDKGTYRKTGTIVPAKGSEKFFSPAFFTTLGSPLRNEVIFVRENREEGFVDSGIFMSMHDGTGMRRLTPEKSGLYRDPACAEDGTIYCTGIPDPNSSPHIYMIVPSVRARRMFPGYRGK